MNRADFMRNLTDLLADVPPAEREEAIQYYNDYFDDAGMENEQSVIASLGTPEQLVQTIKAGLFDGGSAGEFTEKGFTGYEQKKSNEVLNPSQPGGPDGRDGAGSGNGAWQSNGAGNGNGAWQSNGAGNGNNGWQPNSGNGYGYRQESNAYANYQNPYTGSGSTIDENGKKQNSFGKIALIVLLCILAFPVLLGVGGGLLGGIIGLFGALLGIVIGFGAAAVSLLVVGVCLIVYGIVLLFSIPLGGLCMIGGGLICLAVGLVFLWIIVMIAGALIPAVVRAISSLIHKIFHKGGERA